MRVLIVGPQGAGKGTQADLLAQNLNIPHISTGEIFRANVGAGTELGKLAERGEDIDKVLLVEVPDDVLIERMVARGRADDTPEAIGRRLELYHLETKPLLDYYADKLAAIDGVGTVGEVQQRALRALGR